MAQMPNKNEHLVMAVYDTVARAEEAQSAIHAWDKATDSIKLGKSAVIYKDPTNGKLKYHRSGSKNWLVGGAIGLVVMTFVGGLILPIAGAAIGAFTARHQRVKSDEADQVAAQLDQGKAAVAVMCDYFEVQPVSDELRRLGGRVVSLEVPSDTMNQATQAVQQAADQGQLPAELAAAVPPPVTPPPDTGPTAPTV
jgi:uncharacterized membrane protein